MEIVICEVCNNLFDVKNAGMGCGHPDGPKYWCSKCKPPMDYDEGGYGLGGDWWKE